MVQIEADKKFKAVKELKKYVSRFQGSLMNFTKDANFLTKIEEEAGFIEEKFSDFKNTQISEYQNIASNIDKLEEQLDNIEESIEQGMLIKENEIKKNPKKISKNIPDTSTKVVDYIQDLYD